MTKQKAPVCPRCGNESVRSKSKFGTRHDCCGLWSYGYKPLTTRETHRARIEAHAAFDPLWKSEGWKRSEAYAMLSAELEIRGEECHMGSMPLERLIFVPEAVERIRAKGPRVLPPESLMRTKLSQAMPRCGCGNILSVARQNNGTKTCPRCD